MDYLALYVRMAVTNCVWGHHKLFLRNTKNV